MKGSFFSMCVEWRLQEDVCPALAPFLLPSVPIATHHFMASTLQPFGHFTYRRHIGEEEEEELLLFCFLPSAFAY